MVPAFVPDGFSRQEERGVRRLVGLVRAYEQVFGHEGVPGLADRMDTIITSVGPASRSLGYGQGSLLQGDPLAAAELPDLIHGDIGGVCFPRAGLTAVQINKFNALATRWTGMRRIHLEACARRAATGNSALGPPGVVMISTGEERAHIVLYAVEQGLVNHLIIDHRLGVKLIAILRSLDREIE
jgi:hypothetical protein